MEKFSTEDIKHISKLSCLKFDSDSVCDFYAQQLTSIIGILEKLKDVKTESIQPMAGPINTLTEAKKTSLSSPIIKHNKISDGIVKFAANSSIIICDEDANCSEDKVHLKTREVHGVLYNVDQDKQGDILTNAPHVALNCFVVPKTVE